MSKVRRRQAQPKIELDDLLNPDKLRSLKSGTDLEIASYKGENLQAEVRVRVRPRFEASDFHPKIVAVSKKLYDDGHYRNAVFDASVALVNYVKKKSRRRDLDGVGLVTTVFSKNNPVLAFNDRKNKSDEDVQEGMMHVFMGAILSLRNPRAHALLDDSPELALEYIGLLSFLAKRLDQAKRVMP